MQPETWKPDNPWWSEPPQPKIPDWLARELRPYFAAGPNPTKGNRNAAWRRVHEALDGCGRRLCLFYTNPAKLHDRRLAALLGERDIDEALSWGAGRGGIDCDTCGRPLVGRIETCECRDWRTVALDVVGLDRRSGNETRPERMLLGLLRTWAASAIESEADRVAAVLAKRRWAPESTCGLVIDRETLELALGEYVWDLDSRFDPRRGPNAAMLRRQPRGFLSPEGETTEAVIDTALRSGELQPATWGGLRVSAEWADMLRRYWYRGHLSFTELRAYIIERADDERRRRRADDEWNKEWRKGHKKDATLSHWTACPKCGADVEVRGQRATCPNPKCRSRKGRTTITLQAALRRDTRASLIETSHEPGGASYINSWAPGHGVTLDVMDPKEGAVVNTVGRETTNVSELAATLRPLGSAAIRKLLAKHGRDVPKGKHFPRAWLDSPAGRRFWTDAVLARDLFAVTTGKINSRFGCTRN